MLETTSPSPSSKDPKKKEGNDRHMWVHKKKNDEEQTKMKNDARMKRNEKKEHQTIQHFQFNMFVFVSVIFCGIKIK